MGIIIMDYHAPISPFKHPVIWMRDKYETGLNAKGLYVIALLPLLPGLLGLIALCADLMTIFGIDKATIASEKITTMLAVFLFVYGLLNLVFLYVITRASVRLGRERDNYRILHKKIIEEIRDYRTHKRREEGQKKRLSLDEIKRYISEILSKFNDNYMAKMHTAKVSAVIKCRHSNTLDPIRVGGDRAERNNEPELLEESFIYKALNETGKTMRYIYVKNLDNPDKYECEALGKHLSDVKKRSQNKYSTFIALPIRTGQEKHVSSGFTDRQDLGMLGFDLKRKYGFGNFEEHELEYIACFVDMMSELVQDLNEADTQKVNNITNQETQ